MKCETHKSMTHADYIRPGANKTQGVPIKHMETESVRNITGIRNGSLTFRKKTLFLLKTVMANYPH